MYYDLLHDFLAYLQSEHQKTNYTTDYRVLAAHLGAEIYDHEFDAAILSVDWLPAITINPHDSAERRRFTGMHENAHIMLEDSGVEEALMELHAGEREEAEPYIEKFCNVGASHLLMPHPYVATALSYWDYTPMAILELSRLTGASLQAALRRIVHLEENSCVAGFITSGHAILDVSRHKCRLPYRKWDLLPESHPVFQATAEENTKICIEETDLLCTYIPGTRKRLALVIAN